MVKQSYSGIDSLEAKRAAFAKKVIRIRPKRNKKNSKKITPKAKPKAKRKVKTKFKCVGTPVAKRWKRDKEVESVITLGTAEFLRANLVKLEKERRELQEKVNKMKEAITVHLPNTDKCMKDEDCKIQFTFDNMSPSLEKEDMEYLDTMMNGAFKNEVDLNATYDTMRYNENSACLADVLNETAHMDDEDAVKLLFDTASFVTDDLFKFDFDCEL